MYLKSLTCVKNGITKENIDKLEIPIIWSGLRISRKPKPVLLTLSKLKPKPSPPCSKNLLYSPGLNNPTRNPIRPFSMMISSILINSLKNESRWVMLNSPMKLSGIHGKVLLHLLVIPPKIIKRRKEPVALENKIPIINSKNNSLTLTSAFWYSNPLNCSNSTHWDKKYSELSIEQPNNHPKTLPILTVPQISEMDKSMICSQKRKKYDKFCKVQSTKLTSLNSENTSMTKTTNQTAKFSQWTNKFHGLSTKPTSKRLLKRSPMQTKKMKIFAILSKRKKKVFSFQDNKNCVLSSLSTWKNWSDTMESTWLHHKRKSFCIRDSTRTSS